ncbi:MAG: tetratricopeptide repeat protein [Candidatus Lokiarchaeota archaeon]|nr:tetratricopeptide repeat protein [Candidatus Lokiarchaeota archaeon]
MQAYSSLGNFYQLSGRLNEAEATYNQAIEFKKTRAAEISYDGVLLVVSSIHTELGIVHRKRDEFAAMVPCFEAALEITKRLAASSPDEYKPRLAESWNNLGTALRKVGKHDDAWKAYQTALELRNGLAVPGNPDRYHDLANTQANIGTLLREQGKLEESKAAFEAAVEAHQKIPAGEAKPFMATRANLFNSLGVVKNDLEDFAGAIEYYKKALAVYERSIGEKAASRVPEMAMVCNNIASAYKSAGQLDAAEQAFLKSYELYKGLVQEEPHVYSRFLKVAMENLRIFYSQVGKQESGLRLVKDTLEFIQQVAGVVDGKIEAVKGKIDEQLKLQAANAPKKVGRNDPCPCGSGKKYKRCCLPKGRNS